MTRATWKPIDPLTLTAMTQAQHYKTATVTKPAQIRMARAALGLSIRELAELAGVNKATIVRLEAGQQLRQSTIETIRSSLEERGAEFLAGEESARIAVSVRADWDENK